VWIFCVVGCDEPTLQIVLTGNLKDTLKRRYTCTRLHGVTSRVDVVADSDVVRDFHPNQMLWTASNEISFSVNLRMRHVVTAEGAQVGAGAAGLGRGNVRKMVQGMNSWRN
jgi:hypothetical protein